MPLVNVPPTFEVYLEGVRFPVRVKAWSMGEAEKQAIELHPRKSIYSVRKIEKIL